LLWTLFSSKGVADFPDPGPALETACVLGFRDLSPLDSRCVRALFRFSGCGNGSLRIDAILVSRPTEHFYDAVPGGFTLCSLNAEFV